MITTPRVSQNFLHWRIFAAAIILLAGCTTSSGARLDDIDTASRDPACVRQCSASYSECAGRASNAMGMRVSEILSACKSSMQVCVSTCPRQ